MSGTHAVRHAEPFGSYLTGLLYRRGLSVLAASKLIGVSDTLVGTWCHGRALPTLERAETIATALNDNRVLQIVRKARTGVCARTDCARPFMRRPRTRQIFCSSHCWRVTSKHPDRRRDPRQDAIDAMCAGCEPDNICRTADCPLRAYSPFPYIPMRAA